MSLDEGRGLRSVVLLVDDNPAHHDIVHTSCEASGLNVLQAGDAATAIQFAEQTLPVAVICALDGNPSELLDLVRELRRCSPQSMIIAVADDRTAVLDAGADTVLHRPLDPQIVAGLIEASAPSWSSATPTTGAHRKRVLVIEHEPPTAVTIRNWLAASYEVVVVASGWRALDDIAQHGAPDAVLAELRLPDIEAGELFDALEAASPGLSERTIFMSAGFVADRAQTFLTRIPGRWIPKPLTLAPLLRMLASVVREPERFS